MNVYRTKVECGGQCLIDPSCDTFSYVSNECKLLRSDQLFKDETTKLEIYMEASLAARQYNQYLSTISLVVIVNIHSLHIFHIQKRFITIFNCSGWFLVGVGRFYFMCMCYRIKIKIKDLHLTGTGQRWMGL